MSVQINFKIALESNALSMSAVSSLSNGVSSGQFATAFASEAALRNEV